MLKNCLLWILFWWYNYLEILFSFRLILNFAAFQLLPLSSCLPIDIFHCCCSVAQSCLTLCDSMDCSTPGLPVPHHLSKFAQVHVHLHWWCHPATSSSDTLFFCHQSFPADSSNESTVCIRWPKDWSFSFSISPSNGYSGLISLEIDWFGLLAIQGTLRNLLQHHTLKASILWCSAFFMVHLSHSYVTAGKTIALTIWTFVSRVRFSTQNLDLS